ncbi:MAG: PQQ-binding-like beta-propeller repeat protein [Planctomyces sp.]
MTSNHQISSSLPSRKNRIVCTLRLLIVLMSLHFMADHAVASAPAKIGAEDWPSWRGPTGDGIVADNQKVATEWDGESKKNIAWSIPIPGRGHGSPIVVGDQIVIATAVKDPEKQLLLCFDKKDGKQIWESVIHEGNQPTKGNTKSTLASSSAACDGTLYFINFLNGDSAWTTAVDRNGKKVWQTRISEFKIHQGFGSSPLIFEDLVLVTSDNDAGGAVTALNRETGEVVWTRKRPQKPNYTSPVVVKAAGKTQLIVIGCNLVTSLDPKTGKELWEVEGATTECVTSTVTDGERVFTSGGYPKNHIAAVAADGSGKVVWENTLRAYVPSLLYRDGHLFAVLDAGVATCLRSDTGEEVWKERLKGTFSGSPVMIGNTVYCTNEEGQTFVFEATPKAFRLIATNQLGDSCFATPTICGGSIYLRSGHSKDGQRQEMLSCIRIAGQ